MPMISIATDANAMPLDEVARARIVMAALGDTPIVEETAQSACSWLLSPAKPAPESFARADNSDAEATAAQRRLAASNAPTWLVPR